MELAIFKFVSQDGKLAFVVAKNSRDAYQIIKKSTTLKVEIIDSVDGQNFPYILDKVDNKPGIYINYIIPF